MTTVLEAAEGFAKTTYDWLASLDPASFQSAGIREAREGLGEVLKRSEALREALEADASEEMHRLATDARTLQSSLPTVDSVGNRRMDWLDLRVGLSPLYEAFVLSLKAAGGRGKHLHPTNVLRSAVHMASGLLMVAAFDLVFTQLSGMLTALVFVIWAWGLEYARRSSPTVNRWCMAFFGPIARDHERYRINSATWYGTALLVLTLTAWGPAGVLGILALAIGDPVAGWIGRSYGETRWWGGKSVEGSVAFALAATTACFLYLVAVHPSLAGSFTLLGVAAVAGITGAIVELLSTRLEDNFTIPVLTAWVVLLVMPT